MKLAIRLCQESAFASGSTPEFFTHLENGTRNRDYIQTLQSVIVSLALLMLLECICRWGSIYPQLLAFCKGILAGLQSPAKHFQCLEYLPENPGVKGCVFIVLCPPPQVKSNCTAFKEEVPTLVIGASVSCRCQSRTSDKWQRRGTTSANSAIQQNKVKSLEDPHCPAADKDWHWTASFACRLQRGSSHVT